MNTIERTQIQSQLDSATQLRSGDGAAITVEELPANLRVLADWELLCATGGENPGCW
jgi:hypothetical protein